MRRSLRLKTIILLALATFVLSMASLLVAARLLSNSIENNYKTRAAELSSTVALSIDADAVAELKGKVIEIYDKTTDKVTSDYWGTDEFVNYVTNYSELSTDPAFNSLKGYLKEIQDVNDIDCAYIYWYDKKDEVAVVLVDAAEEDACPIGCIDTLVDVSQEVLENPDAEPISFITDSEPYGKLITAASPIYTYNRELVGYAMIDIDMDEISSIKKHQILLLLLIDAIISFIICLIAIHFVNKQVISPINMLSDAASNYFLHGRKDIITSHDAFADMKLHTGDEIEKLLDSMKKMEQDSNRNIENIISMSRELSDSKHEAIEMNKQARMDALTGVFNRRAYEEALSELNYLKNTGDTRFGMVVFDLNNLKDINDIHGHDKGNKYITNACNKISHIFKNSSIYRIGGDEFVVILTDRDYENIRELINELEETIVSSMNDDSLKPWERFYTAYGYALFEEKTDRDAIALFKRADRIMYDKKTQMKNS